MSGRLEGKVAVVTGGASGIGEGTVRRFVEEGARCVIADIQDGPGQTLAKELGDATVFVHTDVSHEDEVAAVVAAAGAAFGRLDCMVNNAGILGAVGAVGETTAEQLREVFETNVFGVVRVTQAFLPLPEASEAPAIVNVSSGMGSLARTTDPERIESSIVDLPYPSSKAALNMVTNQYSKGYPGMRINAVDPGYTATDFNAHSGPQSVEEGAEIIVRAAQFGADGPTGAYLDREGVVPW
jgi:NAD(P)-dependent dehydrogenase (short-subunit alcohol dehydrogenase family)